jgi:hypothetical protein
MILSSAERLSLETNVNMKDSNEDKSVSRPEDKLTNEILQALKGLQFGEVVVTVRDGRVVQIDRIARNRQLLTKKKLVE